MKELLKFTEEIKVLFINNLKQETTKTKEDITRESNYLMTSMLGLSLGSRILNDEQLDDYIETTFKNI
jgi:TetR/AcrR family transcriptional repressor of nem operon